MILQALNIYYERMASDQDSGMPSFGTSVENISFALVLAADGTLRGVEDLREQNGKKLRPRKMPVPAAVTRTSGVKANFLWDKAAYLFGADGDGPSESNRLRFDAFNELLQVVGSDIEDSGFSAVRSFLQSWDSEQAEELIGHYQPWEDVCNASLVFRLDGTPGFIHDRQPVQREWLKYSQENSATPQVQCLITGEENVPLARVHTPIKGVRGGQTSGGYIVSFNATAFTSYGQDKAAVAETSAFAYTTALNALLTGNSRQKINIGDTTLVFWAACASPAESFFADLFDPPGETDDATDNEDDQQTTSKIHGLLRAIRDGRRATDFLPDLDEDVQFYILGLSPNAARLSIRFWEANSLGTLLSRVGKHFEQLSIIQQFDNEPEFPPLWRLLCQTATIGKTENVSPVLAGGMARAMLTGCRYPQNLLPVVLERIRAEHNVTYFRAALIKAYLMRNKSTEVSVSLDLNRTDLPYLLGRLFAVLEKAQEEAIPNANATIKDRYLASASATPGQVFHMLLKNSANHIAKLRKNPEKRGRAIYYDIMTQDIIAGFSDYPKMLKAEEQGLFMIGYYHQRKDFYTKKNQEG
ncbi:MAG: type I-C CRISPR-associated protein Cas8c/Csd1 [Desulfuromonadaceae bacterium]|nr:type I-C CRISPR-associated protein Cas8c/Csd1 [Desulfuromonadaceae bacterium]